MERIDFVIIWVDGNNPEWQQERERYKAEDIEDDRLVRYRDMDTLRFWFRAVEQYAPWVNRIHFVTWGDIPNWLNTDHPKMNVVNHQDFIPEKYLPTFNSHTIELNLHRIKGLSEQFVYFNDDMFLINPVKPQVFFVQGKPCDSAVLSPTFMTGKYSIGCICLNNMSIINTYFDKREVVSENWRKWFSFRYEIKQLVKNIILMPWDAFPGFQDFHICNSFLKETFEVIWEKEWEILDQTCQHRFRNVKLDTNQWLMRYWQLTSGHFHPRTTRFGRYYDMSDKPDYGRLLSDKRTKAICVNDVGLCDKEFDEAITQFKTNFERKLPKKSVFEK